MNDAFFWHLTFISLHFFAFFAFLLCDTLREMSDIQFLAKTRKGENAMNAKKKCKFTIKNKLVKINKMEENIYTA